MRPLGHAVVLAGLPGEQSEDPLVAALRSFNTCTHGPGHHGWVREDCGGAQGPSQGGDHLDPGSLSAEYPRRPLPITSSNRNHPGAHWSEPAGTALLSTVAVTEGVREPEEVIVGVTEVDLVVDGVAELEGPVLAPAARSISHMIVARAPSTTSTRPAYHTDHGAHAHHDAPASESNSVMCQCMLHSTALRRQCKASVATRPGPSKLKVDMLEAASLPVQGSCR